MLWVQILRKQKRNAALFHINNMTGIFNWLNTKPNYQSENLIDVSQLKAGVYYAEITNSKGERQGVPFIKL